MCGIFSYIGHKNNAGALILEGLKSLEYRGYDSWGMALKKNDGKIHIEKHTGKIGDATMPNISTTIGIGHTRWATHGGVTKNNTHPHTDCTKKILIVHNGIVENFSKLKKQLILQKHVFSSETDSEVIAHLLEEEMKRDTNRRNIVQNVFQKLTGMNAFIVLFQEYEELYAIKNGSPIVFAQNKKEKIIASDVSVLVPYTKSVYFLDDYELLMVNKVHTRLFNSDQKEKKIKFIQINYSKQEIGLGRFPHYMIKEISEQPKILSNIIDTQQKTIEKAAELIQKSYGSYLLGCGTAYYAALSGTYLFSKIVKRHINASIGSEFLYLVDFLKKTSLVIALSQSGETIDIISSLRKVQKKKAKILAITNVLGSTLFRMADEKILLNAGPEKCVLATKSFTAKIAILYLIAHSLNKTYLIGIKHLKKAIKEVKKLIQSDQIKNLASKLQNHQHIYILGRGVSYSTALESALKIKEVSYIHAEGFAGGELKHGVIALIEKNTPVIIYNPEDETYEDTLSSAYEVKARGAYIIGISNKLNAVYDEFIKVGNCQEATIIPNVVVAQLMGYYLALSKGYDPDKPRNLAKSVTVK
jgi:glucosamine--fructose-6-phosphate aminotransferase (isomerizing)